MKKAFALILALALCMALLAACGSTSSSSSSSTSSGTSSGTSSSSSSSSSEPAAPSGEKTVVTVWCMHAEDEEPTKPYQRLLKWAEDYNANNTDNIEVVVSGAKTADVILTTVASGGTPDIFQNFWNNAPTWANNGALLDLTEYVNAEDAEWDKSDFVDSTWELCTYQDKIYSVPMTVSSTYLFYNKTMLADAGWTEFPKTMDELAQCIKDCTKVGDDGAIQQMGLIPDYPWLDNVLWPVAFGAEYIDESGKITFDSPEMMQAYQFQADIYNEYGYDEIKRFVDTLGARATNEDPLFTGKIAIRWQGDSAVASMVQAAKETNTEMGIVELPPAAEGGTSQSMLTGGVWEVNAKTANPEATIKVLKSLTGKEAMAYFAEGDFGGGNFQPRKSALTAVTELDTASEEAKQIAVMLRDGTLRAFPMSSYVNEYLNEISTYMSEAIAGNTTVEEAVKAVVEAVQPLADAEG